VLDRAAQPIAPAERVGRGHQVTALERLAHGRAADHELAVTQPLKDDGTEAVPRAEFLDRRAAAGALVAEAEALTDIDGDGPRRLVHEIQELLG
jgi:hypothetical protein